MKQRIFCRISRTNDPCRQRCRITEQGSSSHVSRSLLRTEDLGPRFPNAALPAFETFSADPAPLSPPHTRSRFTTVVTANSLHCLYRPNPSNPRWTCTTQRNAMHRKATQAKPTHVNQRNASQSNPSKANPCQPRTRQSCLIRYCTVQ
jgi:hypothetical protein